MAEISVQNQRLRLVEEIMDSKILLAIKLRRHILSEVRRRSSDIKDWRVDLSFIILYTFNKC